jgi:hypothetical protein
VEGDVCGKLAEVYRRENDLSMTLRYAQRAIEVRRHCRSMTLHVRRTQPPTAHAQVLPTGKNVDALFMAADALQGLGRYRGALILMDEAIAAAEGDALESEEDAIKERLSLYSCKMLILRHLGRLEEALDICGMAFRLLRPDLPGQHASDFLAEAARVHEARGRLDLALGFDAARARCGDKRCRSDPDVVRRCALNLAGEGRRDDALETLRYFQRHPERGGEGHGWETLRVGGQARGQAGIVGGDAQTPANVQGPAAGGRRGGDGSLPGQAADEIRQVGSARTAHMRPRLTVCLTASHVIHARQTRTLGCSSRLTQSRSSVQVEKLMGQVRQRDEAARAKLLEQAREELLAGRAELRREQAARKKRTDRRRRKRTSKAKAQQQHQPPEAQEEKEETGPPSGECDAAVAEAVAAEEEAAPAPLRLEGEKGESWSDCSICLEALDEREAEAEGAEALRVEALASCPHSFHSGCLDLWVARCAAKALAPTCPDCRAGIDR